MKKRLFSLALIAVMAISMLAGCGGKKDEASVYYLNFKPEQNDAWHITKRRYLSKGKNKRLFSLFYYKV